MAVTVDLGQLPFQKVMPIIEWCLENNIDKERCIYFLYVWTAKPAPTDVDWTLTIPDKFATMFILRWL